MGVYGIRKFIKMFYQIVIMMSINEKRNYMIDKGFLKNSGADGREGE